MRTRINVTALDIEKGKREDGEACMVARALGRNKHFAGKNLSVTYDSVWTPDGDVPVPEHVGRLISDWDLGLEVHPFTFSIEVPA